jgi:hypothetical protein
MADLNQIKEQVEQRLQEKQSNREFKDIGRVAQTKKEKAAFRLINSKVLTDLEDDAVMAYNMVKKDNVWSPIDVQAQKESGVTSGAAFLKVKIREAVPTRPKDEKGMRKSYVLFLESLQNKLDACFNVQDIRDMADYYRNMPMNEVIATFFNPDYATADEDTKKAIEDALKQNRNIRMAFMYQSSSLVKKIINELLSSRFENMLFRASDAAVTIWSEALQKEPISEEKSKELIDALKEREMKFVAANQERIAEYQRADRKQLILIMENEWRIPSISKSLYKQDMEKFRDFIVTYVENKIRRERMVYATKILDSAPRANNWSWFETAETKDETKKETAAPKEQAINTKAPLSYIKRTGGYKIPEITPAEVVNKFGFAAVNYGQYVDDKWSKEHTKHFLAAISDMAEMINIDIKKANQLGKLKIAFGAKGRKGHAAAYFPQTKDINLTKSNGDGSVAHEWGHYFDNVIVELDQQRATNQFASEGYSPDNELKTLFKELFSFIYKGNDLYTPKVPMKFKAEEVEDVPTYSVWDSQQRRWVSKSIEIKATIEQTINELDLDDFAVVDEGQLSRQVKVFGYIIKQFGLESYEVPMKLKTSYLYHKTAYSYFQYVYLDPKSTYKKYIIGGVRRTKYWTSAVELFARAWETWILKKLFDADRVSNYLVADIPMEDIIAEGYQRPYPAGKELEYIGTFMDKIVEVAKRKYDIGDFVPPSDIREDQYIDYKGKSGETGLGMVVDNKKSGEKVVDFVKNDEVINEVVEPSPAELEAKMQEQMAAVVPPAEPEPPVIIPEPDNVVSYPELEATREEILETIAALEILAEMGDKDAEDTLEALKLLV